MLCNRCQKPFMGSNFLGVTCGYYDTHCGEWAKFANPGEKVVCDGCMHSDPRYIAVYGVQHG